MRSYDILTADQKILYNAQSVIGEGVINSEISLRHLYTRLASGQTLGDIRKDFPKIQKSRLLLARAFFHAVNPDGFKQRVVDPLKVLVDENIDEHIVTDTARRVFGEATHVAFVGLADAPDIKLWQYAMKHNFNLIVSKDRAMVQKRPTMDLTLCAENTWRYRLRSNGNMIGKSIEKLPRLLHIMDGSIDGIEISKRLVSNRLPLFSAFEECSSHVIQLHRDKVKPGRHFMELIEKGQFEKARQQRDEIVEYILAEYGLKRQSSSMEESLNNNMLVQIMQKTESKERQSIIAEIKRVAEHEMAEQISLSHRKMMSNIALIEKVRAVLAPTFDSSTKETQADALRLIVANYKVRGIESIMIPRNYRKLVA